MLKKAFSVMITALLLLSMRLNILGTVSAEEFDKNVKGEKLFLSQYMTGEEVRNERIEEVEKELINKLLMDNQQRRQKLFSENIPKALAFIKEHDKEFYDLVTKDDKLREEYENDFMKHVELWRKFQDTASPRVELELKQLIFSWHLELLERQYREEKNKDKRIQIRDGMKKLLTRLFDVKINIREFEIEELQAELNKLKEQLENAKNHKTEQIDIFLMRMIASDEDTIFDD